jgi:hypothetical protein
MQVQSLEKEKKKKVPASHARGCRHQELLQGLSQPQGHVEVGGVFCQKEIKSSVGATTTAKCARVVELVRKRTADAEKKKVGSFSGGREPVQLITIAAS